MEYLKLVGEIFRQFPGQFILFVILPAIFGALTGVVSLKNQLESKKEVSTVKTEVSAVASEFDTVKEDVNVAADKVDTLNAESKKQLELIGELEKKDEEIEELQTKLKDFQERTLHIRAQTERMLNWERKAFDEVSDFYIKYPVLDKQESSIIEAAKKRFFENLFDERNKRINDYRIVDTKTKRIKRWSAETLYQYFSNSNSYWNSIDNQIAVCNEIAITKNKYFVGELYKIATTNRNIKLSFAAAKSICIITNYEPYQNENQFQLEPNKRLVYDTPKFNILTQWWEKEGKNKKLYNCPFDEIDNFHFKVESFEHSEGVTYAESFGFIDSILIEYPLLARTKGEQAYLMLLFNDESIFDEVEKDAKEACSMSEDQILPHLVLAYINIKKGEIETFEKQLDLARKNAKDLKELFWTTYTHEKLRDILGYQESQLFYK